VCPSAPLATATHLIGLVRPDGRVAFISPPLEVTDEVVAAASDGPTPETRLRFAGPCLEGRCAQWTGSRCSVADAVVDELAHVVAAEGRDRGPLRPCALRRSCRWFDQRGAAACRACPLVVTDTRLSPAQPA
jgi:hypothetical protein